MKQLQCPDCDASVETMYEGNAVEEIMQAMMPHYKEAHADVMQNATPEKHQAWMTDFKKSFEEATELPEKTIGCYFDGCDVTFSGGGRNTLLKEIYAHYMEVHPDVIPKATDEEKKVWMEQFEKDWTAA